MIWTLAFWKGASERALKTFAQTFLATVGVGTALSLGKVDWKTDASIAAVATILSIFTSIGNASFTAGAVAQANASAVLTKNLGGTQPAVGPIVQAPAINPAPVVPDQSVFEIPAAPAAVTPPATPTP